MRLSFKSAIAGAFLASLIHLSPVHAAESMISKIKDYSSVISDSDLLELDDSSLYKVAKHAFTLEDGSFYKVLNRDLQNTLELQLMNRANLNPEYFDGRSFMTHKSVMKLTKNYLEKYSKLNDYKIDFIWGDTVITVGKKKLEHGRQFFLLDTGSKSLNHVKLLFADHDQKIAYYFESFEPGYEGTSAGTFLHDTVDRNAESFRAALGDDYRLVSSRSFVQSDDRNCMVFSVEAMKVIANSENFTNRLKQIFSLEGFKSQKLVVLKNLLPEFMHMSQSTSVVKAYDSWYRYTSELFQFSYISLQDAQKLFLSKFQFAGITKNRKKIAGYLSELDTLLATDSKKFRRIFQLKQLIAGTKTNWEKIYLSRYGVWKKANEFAAVHIPMFWKQDNREFFADHLADQYGQIGLLNLSGDLGWMTIGSSDKIGNRQVENIRLNFILDLYKEVKSL